MPKDTKKAKLSKLPIPYIMSSKKNVNIVATTKPRLLLVNSNEKTNNNKANSRIKNNIITKLLSGSVK